MEFEILPLILLEVLDVEMVNSHTLSSVLPDATASGTAIFHGLIQIAGDVEIEDEYVNYIIYWLLTTTISVSDIFAM